MSTRARSFRTLAAMLGAAGAISFAASCNDPAPQQGEDTQQEDGGDDQQQDGDEGDDGDDG